MKGRIEPQSQSDRFIEMAHELGCDEDEDRFNETLKRIAQKKDESSPQDYERAPADYRLAPKAPIRL